MEELSIEQKAKAYDEALEKARIWKDKSGMPKDKQGILDDIFPELKENENEKTKRMLHSISSKMSFHLRDIFTEEEFQCFDAWSNAWLEKQGEHANFINKIQIGDKVTRNRDGVLVNLSQLNRVAKVEEKQGEQKPDDKVEPKFNVDDFILNGDVTDDGKPEIFKVLNVQDTWYAVENIYDGRNTIITFKQDSSCRLWDLRDAKDGDFLVYGKDKLPFIFKGFDRFHPNCPVAYCGICEDGTVGICTGDGWWTDEEILPATKEQREQLEKAIADAGYIWNAEKRELKEIEQKPTDEEMKTLLQTEYEKGRADAIAEMQKLAWSEDDEKTLNGITNYLCMHDSCRLDGFDKWYDFLKSLKYRVQPKQEWSEEDKKNLEKTIWYVEKGGELIFTKTDKLVSWLKSLRPQWKPSDEQIEILDMVLTDEAMDDNIAKILRELREQLKKLK